ncbi:MAG: ribose-5-phosphate isomerase RpiA [Chlamydiales bacterium]|nr:ribose-5-phosphate isomerase RpiA [Chlamydiales bacterium]
MSVVEIKKELGKKAAQLVQNGMIVGLGTGSTAECFIQSLVDRLRLEGLKIKMVASSKESAQLVMSKGLQVADLNEVSHVDLTVDGADEIDPQKRLIKGAGGALLREKILAAASREMVVIADESKLVAHLGKTKLPLEILPYGARITQLHLEALGFKGQWRGSLKGKGSSIRLPHVDEDLFATEQGNVILDLFFDQPLREPNLVHEELIRIPGVIETGFFFGLAGRILIGRADGKIETIL